MKIEGGEKFIRSLEQFLNVFRCVVRRLYFSFLGGCESCQVLRLTAEGLRKNVKCSQGDVGSLQESCRFFAAH